MIKKSKEQQLIDICFSLTMRATDKDSLEYFSSASNKNEKVAEWVAGQLRACGFNTVPMGSSWGVLRE